MRSIILYGSFTKLTNAHKLVTTPNSHPPGYRGAKPLPEYFVRAEAFAGDCLEALHNAKPLPGELVLNTADIQ